jgi:predicted site-specific integrase-resolvase
MSPDDPLLEVAVVAKRLKKCPHTIRRYIKQGRLQAERQEGATRGVPWLVPESAIRSFLRSSRTNKKEHLSA